MRISDWSSDVCSSDLGRVNRSRFRVLPHHLTPFTFSNALTPNRPLAKSSAWLKYPSPNGLCIAGPIISAYPMPPTVTHSRAARGRRTYKIRRAHVRTTVPNEHILYCLLL